MITEHGGSGTEWFRAPELEIQMFKSVFFGFVPVQKLFGVSELIIQLHYVEYIKERKKQVLNILRLFYLYSS